MSRGAAFRFPKSAAPAAIALLLGAVAVPPTARAAVPSALRAAQWLLELGRPVVALDSARVALAAVEAAGVGDSLLLAEAATTFANAGLRAGLAGDLEVERRARQAVALYDAAPNRSTPARVRAMAVLANIAMATGNLSEAVALRERSVALWRAEPGPQWRLAADLDALAQIAGRRGEYSEAWRLYEEALRVLDAAPDADPAERVETLSDATGALLNLGRIDEADRLSSRALHLADSLHAATGKLFAPTLFNRAEVCAARHDEAAARSLYERARAELAASPGAEPRTAAMAAGGAAEHALAAGDVRGATERIREALAIHEGLGARRGLPYAYDLATLARVLEAAGDLAASCDADRKALAAFDEVGTALTRAAVGTACHLAAVTARLGDPAASVAAALDAERRRRSQIRLVARGLSEREALRYAAGGPPALDVALDHLARSPAADSLRIALFDAMVRSRGIVLDELAARRHLAASGDSLVRRAWEHVRAARERLAYLHVAPPRGMSRREQNALIDRAAAQVESRESELAHASRNFAKRRSLEGAGAADVHRALPPGSGLLAFRVVTSAEGQSRYAVFVDRPGQAAPALVDLGPRETIDAAIDAWSREIRTPAPFDGGAGGYRRAGVALRRLLWDPIAPLTAACERIFVVPEGAIYVVSFSTLPVDRDRYVADAGPLIHYLGAERDLLASGAGAAAPPSGGLFTCGNPEFERRSSAGLSAKGPPQRPGPCADFAALRFEPLPQSGAELDEIVSLWTQVVRRGSVTTLTGADATEARFACDAPGHEILHIATHGFFIDPYCAAPAAKNDTPPSGRGSLPGAVPVSPLLLSGLALAGANDRVSAAGAATDGILLADEIAALDFEGTGAVVLSACDTGLGLAVVGEGILGVRRAFAVAGARTVLMTLWPVPDATLRRWSRSFYRERFGRGADVPQAVRAAEGTLLAARRAAGQSTHPAYWAGLVAAGEWR